jgi:hypothetical protein
MCVLWEWRCPLRVWWVTVLMCILWVAVPSRPMPWVANAMSSGGVLWRSVFSRCAVLCVFALLVSVLSVYCLWICVHNICFLKVYVPYVCVLSECVSVCLCPMDVGSKPLCPLSICAECLWPLSVCSEYMVPLDTWFPVPAESRVSEAPRCVFCRGSNLRTLSGSCSILVRVLL